MSYASDIVNSECLRQAGHKSAVTQADHTAADVAHFQRMLLAECTWPGNSNSALAALKSLGASFFVPPIVSGANPS